MNKDLLQRALLRKVTYRYVIAVALIAFLALTAFFYSYQIHQKKQTDYKIINLTGRQRMLSQKLALLVLRGSSQKELEQTVKSYEVALDQLTHTRFNGKDYPRIRIAYNEIKDLSDEFVKLSLAQSQNRKDEVFHLSQKILKLFDEVTFLKQQVSEEEFKESFKLQGLILLSTILLLLLEIFLIFKPMTHEILESFTKLSNIEEKSFENSRLALIGQTAATIGHEIKNPLFVILSYSQSATGDLEKKLSKIHQNGERIKKIIEALSVQARDSSVDHMELENLSTIIEDAVDLFEPNLTKHSISLVRNESFHGEISCKRVAISQVIANLLSNAIDSLKDYNEGKREISIETKQEGDFVILRVSDSGKGVPQSLRSEIFKTFVTTKELGSGTGLGLSFSKKVMEEHHGSIKLNAEVSPSCFELSFPHKAT